MFVSQAHSYVLQARLAVTLSWVAGYTNVVTFLACEQNVSHMTGLATELGRDAAQGRWERWVFVASLIGAFFLGAALAGVLMAIGRVRAWRSVYVLPMFVEAALLTAFAGMLGEMDRASHPGGLGHAWVTLVPAAAMGLQNATITRISGGAVRTTHVTGVVTDLGLEAAQLLAAARTGIRTSSATGLILSGKRLVLLGTIVGAFSLGALLGTLAYAHEPALAMLPPVGLLMWAVVVDLLSPIAELRRADQVAGQPVHELPEQLAVYQLHAARSIPGQRQRMPDLLSWSEQLPPRVQVVVLDLGHLGVLDANAALDIGSLRARLFEQGRSLVLAGVTREHYVTLSAHAVTGALDPMSVCDDQELAVARAVALIRRPRTGA